MEKIKKNFGFGCMRLPMKDGDVDTAEMDRTVDAFLDVGFNYFDTAHGYLQGKSETAIRKSLTSRYILTDKLTANFFKTEADIRPFFESQLEACGVDYFDFYLMHAQGAGNYPHFKECHAYETAFALRAEGKVRHIGISFHDKAEILEQILAEYPEIEVVQIQFNYVDYDDPAVQSRECYEVCRRFNKPIIVMEPVKGGNLVKPEDAKADLQSGARPELSAMPESLDGYDEIYLGYPNYWGTMPMAVYTFLEHFDLTGKTIHPFCTHQGSGLSNTEKDIAKAARGAKVEKGLAIHGSHVDDAEADIRKWIKR